MSVVPRPLEILSEAFHRWPFPGGTLRVSNLPVVWRYVGRAPAEVPARLRNGVEVRVRLEDFDGRMLYLFGRPDARVTDLCLSLLRRGDCFLDIGANYGAVGLLASDRVGKEGAVHFFEPQPDLAGRIEEAIGASGRDWLRLHPYGLMDRDAVLRLWTVDGHTGVGSFVDSAGRSGESALELPVRSTAATIPPLVAGRRWGAKVDVEGAELNVLPALLGVDGLRFVLFECSHAEDVERVWAEVSRPGLALFGVARDRLATRTRPIRRAAEIPGHEDLLLVRWDRPLPERSLSPSELAAGIG